MLTESFIAAILSSGKPQFSSNASLKDVGVLLHEFQPQTTFRHGYKKSSSQPGCLAACDSHIFAAQAEKAVVNVYNRAKGNQEATVPFPERIHSLVYVQDAKILILGTEGGKLMLWEVGTGRLTISDASHLQAVTSLCVSNHDVILSGSGDSSVHIWSLSNLISFLQSSSSYSAHMAPKSPIRTFSNHRSGITALACGHSRSTTNFAVSASADKTCYLWRLSDCQVLRTFLLPSPPLCFAMDPADRAVYAGYESGHVQNLQIYNTSGLIRESILNANNETAMQLTMDSAWIPPTTSTGSVNCVELSCDGTTLLTGHGNGKILCWDVAKHRYQKDIIDLGSSVSSIHMLAPEGFVDAKSTPFSIPTVVKPRLELSAPSDNGTVGIPAAYTLQVQITSSARQVTGSDLFMDALAKPYFSRDLVDTALQEMLAHNSNASSGSIISTDPNTDLNLAKMERLQSQVDELTAKVGVLNAYIDKQRKRKDDRLNRLASLGKEKRAAFFEAKRNGKDGIEAMKPWEKKELEVEMEDSSADDEEEEDEGDDEDQGDADAMQT